MAMVRSLQAVLMLPNLAYMVGVTEPIQPKIDSILTDVVATSNEIPQCNGNEYSECIELH